MKRKMFGYGKRKGGDTGRVPGKPVSDVDPEYGMDKDNPPDYEGKEHVKYKNPGFSKHEIKYPKDEPKSKSRVGKEEMHEMEDTFHMDVPDQTPKTLEDKIKRARMKMDAPDQQDPDPLLGNLTHNVGYEGEEDTSGEEEMGPNDMQSNSKQSRKKMIVALTRRRMKKAK